jgi:hypothetical protein
LPHISDVLLENKNNEAKQCRHSAMPPRIIVDIVSEEGVSIEYLWHVIVEEDGTGIEHLCAALTATSHCQPSRNLRH